MNILRINEVKNITSMSNSTIYDLIRKNKFPRPRRIGKRAVGWVENDIQAWLESRPEAGSWDLLKKKNIVAWKIVVTWDNNIEESVDIPDDVADAIDNYLTEMENENGES